ncbi:3-hydroxyacyl-CoA dehydrogenase/enoyl-CoA hydratase family protein [Chelativorans composti]|jgi:3-hydroxyacyl-CoA dehydrogenase|uniref:3-hydroxyacyl-CoA dehydrogenase/enoyl-CoA hydratase family protein n=1 Tax=Chelativorans composti TaxID=768533 RepID=A0ABW5DDQ2_9HYPH
MNTSESQFRAVGVEKSGIRCAAVIGAGSMGSGIAAQFANAGVPVILLDIPGDASARNAAAEGGIARQLKVGGFMHPDAARLVRAGNTEDDLHLLAEADWIVEAIIEKLDAKRDLYRRIAAVRKPDAVVSSNTSTIPLAQLVEGFDAGFVAHFMITHFFNPPRVMRLLELVTAPANAPETVARIRNACETVLGKTVVDCRDTPGFIANRIGCYWLAAGAIEARRLGLTIEEADAVNTALGIPRTGVFGLLDLVGVDLIPPIWGSLMDTLPASDAIHRYDLPGDNTVKKLLAEGRFGRKSGSGYYRMNPDKSRDATDLETGEFRAEIPFAPSSLPGGGKNLAQLLDTDDKFGRYAWATFRETLVYSATHAPEIAGDVESIDKGMELGYAWRQGPFRLADSYGAARVAERLAAEGIEVPALVAAAAAQGGFYVDGKPLQSTGDRATVSAFPVSMLAAVKAKSKPMHGNDAASVWDLGDGVACLEVHTKMNSLAPAVFDVLDWAIDEGPKHFRALVIGNDDPRAFSAGADLSFFARMTDEGQWQAIEDYLVRGQNLYLRLKYSPFPVVAAAHGFALGGGCELMLHANAIVAHAELQAGLPEVKVGLVPGWGGCTQLLLRAQGSGKDALASTRMAFDTIFAGTPSRSALDARANGILPDGSRIVMNRSHLIGAAKDLALEMLAGYAAPERARIAVPGSAGHQEIMAFVEGERAAGRLTDTDVRIASALLTVLTGGENVDPRKPVTEEDIMALERKALLDLIRTPETRARIDHMLKTGEPLKN